MAISERKVKNIFVQNPIMPSFVSDSIAKHSPKTDIGAHSIFLGQVRGDMIDDRRVTHWYSAYEQMALEKMHHIREMIFAKYSLTCMHVYHSIGEVKAGELCFFVFTSAPHRKSAIEACEEVVEVIKNELPVYGKGNF